MKKCIHISLVFLFLFNSFGYVILFLKLQEDIKKEVLQKISAVIPEKDLLKISFFKNDKINWKETNEFEYHGAMYDVVKREDKGNYIVLYCFNDEKEASLLKNFKKQFDDERNKKTNTAGKINLTNFSFTAIPGQIFSFNNQNHLYEQIHIKSTFYNSIKMEVISPPPKCS